MELHYSNSTDISFYKDSDDLKNKMKLTTKTVVHQLHATFITPTPLTWKRPNIYNLFQV
jgi:hypothetical protein